MNIDAPQTADPEILVRVENVSKRFGDFQALRGISFELKKGEVLGFLGPNGAGKTTAMRVMTGYFPPSSGRVFMHGLEFSKHPKKIKKSIGYLPEVIQLYSDMRVIEFLEFAARVKGTPARYLRQQLDAIVERCGLEQVQRRMIGKLSKGYRQRVGLAQALTGNPELLILDEPTSGLDPKQIVEFRELIRELARERTLILSTHILPEVHMLCDRVLILNEGRVVASGTADELGSGLQNQQKVRVTIEAQDPAQGLTLLEGIAGVHDVEVVKSRPDQVTYSVTVEPGADLRAAISRVFVENQIALLEIHADQLSLEQIFMRLVNEEKGNA